MIHLVDQSDPAKLMFHCDQCGLTFAQPNRALLDLHYRRSADADKAAIPFCEPRPSAPVVQAKPKTQPVEPAAVPRKPGRPRKAVQP